MPRAFNLRLVTTLEALRVTYAIGGSVAAMMYSEPRLTIDLDLMVSAPWWPTEAWESGELTFAK